MTKYISMVLAGAASFGILSSFVKLAYQKGYNSAEIAFSQALVGALLLSTLAWLSQREQQKSLLTRKISLSLLGTGAAIGLSTYLYYQSVQTISASLAIVLLMQFTWIGLLLEWVLFQKKPTRMEWVSTLFILAGTVLAGNLLEEKRTGFSWSGVFYVVVASLTYASYIIANSRVGKGIPYLTKSAIIMIGSALAILAVNAPTLMFENHIGSGLLKWALFLALFGTVIPPVLFAKGIPPIGAGLSGILMTAELPVAIITAHFLLKERLDSIQLVGILIMLGSLIAMNVYKGQNE
ncbi:EamA family transporter [Spirosoma aerophilum]